MMMTHILPLCWKCSSRITDEVENVMTIVGCKENPNIHSYDDAKTQCPILAEEQTDE